MKKELIQQIARLLKEKRSVKLLYGTAAQGGIPLEVRIDDKKVGTYWDFNLQQYKDLGSKVEVEMANAIKEWDVKNLFGNYVSKNDDLLADTYNCSFDKDEFTEGLYLDITGYGDWGEGEFTTSGCMEILPDEE